MEIGVIFETGHAARQLNLSPQRIRQLEQAGQLHAFAITASGRRLFRAEDVERLRQRRERRAARE
jgi:DNA-binding transcriptional MerR regulator